METVILNDDQIAQAANFLAKGKLVAFPTETVYGLGADATRPDIVKDVYAAKGRPSDNPLIVHVDGPEMVWQYADLDYKPLAEKLMKRFWPGPLTIIMPIQPGTLSPEVTGGLKTAAFRMPNNQVTLSLIKQFGKPIVGPSANTSGKPSPTEAKHVYHDLNGKIAAILDDGPTKIGVESTVIDLSVDIPTILRPGMVTEDDLIEVLGDVRSDHHKVTQEEIPKAPGMKYKHYAPNAQVIIIDNQADFESAIAKYSQETSKIGILATDQVLNQISENYPKFSLGKDVITASQHLFAGLRELDNSQMDYILAQGFPDTEHSAAYTNRLNKSAGQQHYTK
ncbi:L-threonylcarbamoyladenylate synthase [Companilactobacillus sp.]|uniref:L-threonylcarbamoyladenylate synthase n=1 Tax=Companilactobacillus sp. TaxID=2767905 RepID=UPI0025C3C2E3|nr:L-threonylcarbamoyladenylate synthase [Companilactobacillus sp.]MCH4008488.1 threonylcarbamoyl-AMP synthase [Companilactobacillus sp.]MCH4051333.1 threonylcarbamoyl-AMP synthase [Companilactobacillus sp.]MCH4076431.1 threonylcarbamoyl-AMP synthase [Companilactobacillus sp.]MCH4125006.1 threonylcarbamoyl-AMP synthase [Companilactobacillus sp.]MCH4131548.1 threonylcarbamoyl-AMP synthase [Companilactobacillus sp.]